MGASPRKNVLEYLKNHKGETDIPIWETPADGDLFRPTELVFGKQEPEPKPSVTSSVVPGETLPLSPMRKRIAEHMVVSKHTAPHVTTVMEADLSRVMAHRAANKAKAEARGIHLTFTAYFLAAITAGLKPSPWPIPPGRMREFASTGNQPGHGRGDARWRADRPRDPGRRGIIADWPGPPGERTG